MPDHRAEKLAELLVDYSTGVRPGDRVAVMGHIQARPLLELIFARTVKAGGHPILLFITPETDELLFRHGTREQIEYVHEPLRAITEKYDVRISVIAPDNTKALSGVDPARMVWRDQARAGLMKTMMRRSAAGEFRWVLAPYPTSALAQDADMGLPDYEDFLYRACMPDLDDPIGYWKGVSARQQRIVDWLQGREHVHITGPETDLRLNVAGRKFINCDAHRNVPDGEVFTGPVEDSAEGHVYFSYPAIQSGREVVGVRLWFERGRVVRAAAEKNEEFLLKTLDTDAGSRCLGELAIGTNEGITRFTRQILFDEKIGGSFHMALGAGIPETGSVNESAIHWDMVCDLRRGGEIRVDGDLLYRDGRFVPQF